MRKPLNWYRCAVCQRLELRAIGGKHSCSANGRWVKVLPFRLMKIRGTD